jgi:hypothetical protein
MEAKRKWAFITLHPSLPSRSEQIARARAWGIADRSGGSVDLSPVIVDDISKQPRTTNWAGKFPERERFLSQLKLLGDDGAEIFFATPRCVSFGPKHAEETILAVWEAGALAYVHSTGALYREGDDLTDFVAKVESEANVANTKTSRGRRGAKKKR